MRKLLYWFFVICLLAGPVTAHAWFMMLAGGGVRESGCMSGTYILAWDGDHPSGTTVLCHTSGAGTITGSNTNVPISTSYGENSTYGALCDTGDEYLEWTQTAGQYLTGDDAQTLWMRVYMEGMPSNELYIFEAPNPATSGNGYLTYSINYDMMGRFYDGTSAGYADSGAITHTSWIDVAYSWDPVNQDHALYDDDGGWTGNEDLNEIGTMSGQPTSFHLCNLIIIQSTTPSPNGARVDKWALVDGYKSSVPW